jgi:hypothetical protein
MRSRSSCGNMESGYILLELHLVCEKYHFISENPGEISLVSLVFDQT